MKCQGGWGGHPIWGGGLHPQPPSPRGLPAPPQQAEWGETEARSSQGGGLLMPTPLATSLRAPSSVRARGGPQGCPHLLGLPSPLLGPPPIPSKPPGDISSGGEAPGLGTAPIVMLIAPPPPLPSPSQPPFVWGHLEGLGLGLGVPKGGQRSRPRCPAKVGRTPGCPPGIVGCLMGALPPKGAPWVPPHPRVLTCRWPPPG